MSDFTVIRAVSMTLRALLASYVTSSTDPQLNGIPVDLRSPKELEKATIDKAVSVWLHGVVRMVDTMNDRPPSPAPGQRARPGIPLELGYLVTPVHPNVEVRHALLGRAVQVLHDWSTLRGALLQDTLTGSDIELRVLMHSDLQPSVRDIWTAAQHPLQLSVPYVVQVVVVDSDRPPTQEPAVVRRETTLTQVVGLVAP